MELKIEIPAKVEYMKIQHLPFILELQKFKDKEPSMGDITRMCALFTGNPLPQIRRCPPSEIRNLFHQIVKVFGTYKQGAIPLTLTYPDKEGNDVTYEFIKDFSKLPVDWFIDFDRVDVEEDPIEMIAFCYVEQGMEYGQPVDDGSQNALNPREDRREIFREHVPLHLFLDVHAFFLASWSVLQQLLTEAKNSAQNKK